MPLAVLFFQVLCGHMTLMKNGFVIIFGKIWACEILK